MSSRTRLSLLVISVALSFSQSGSGGLRAAPAREMKETRRIAFRITAIELRGGARSLLSEAVVDGPPGTDFSVRLNSERFRMSAKFLTDPISTTELRVRAGLDTRRLYGYSERNLPLFEEDEQRQSLTLGFDERIVVLPFGRKGDAEQLRIEVTPALSGQSDFLPSGRPRPLEITIPKNSPGGAISVEAFKTPHNFQIEAALLEDGSEVARAAGPALIEDPQELLLEPGPEIDQSVSPLALTLSVDRYIRSRPIDEATISFDIDRIPARDGTRERVARGWSGVCQLQHPLKYDLTDYYRGAPGRKYELRITVKLADGESAD